MNATQETAIVPANIRSRLSALAGGTFKLLALLFAIALVLYVILVAWLHHHLSGQAISITQAAGAPAEAEHILKGLLSWLLAFAIVPAFIRLALESLNPLRSHNSILSRLALLIALGLAFALLPHGIRKLRRVDHAGLPVRMELSDPARAIWWNPDGDPVLFHSIESGGAFRFWNRPGVTPDTGLPSRPVTREIRTRWEESIQKADAEAGRIQQEMTERNAKITELTTSAQSLRNEQLRIQAENEKLRLQREDAERRAREATEKAATEAKARQAEADFAKQVAQLKQRIDDLKKAPTPAPAPAPTPTPAVRQIPSTPSTPSRPAPSEWFTRTIYPSGFLTARGKPNSRIEIRSDGHGLFHTPGSPPQSFSGGHSTFHTTAPEFRLVGRESQPFRITYRWIPQ